MKKFILILSFLIIPNIVWAIDDDSLCSSDEEIVLTCTELRPFIIKGMSLIDMEIADLNGDGQKDYVLVLEDTQNDLRPLLILIRDNNNELKQVKRNDKIILGPHDGGMLGDPFVGIQAESKSFSVSHYGGSRWRWSTDYTFRYSRLDDTWQLVRAEESEFDAAHDEGGKTRVLVPPRDYGKIDIADFDPFHYKSPRKQRKHR